ncbi:uncharacterized protein [Triticum aestivum]|uniref:Uncharacterized protein n=1 Tax=Triticum aestivum TaxID=4565 RepID=A0A077RWI1_WHEAT|nr:uncharacterized protein LOC123069896 isoform X3 [Triticum aestivum]CDM82880.1 unnamed protein product [Triticum aestivum]
MRIPQFPILSSQHDVTHTSPLSGTLAMPPALDAASPTLRTSRPVSRLRRNHRHYHGVHLHLHYRFPSLAADGGGRGRFLLVGTYSASDGSAGQDVGSPESMANSGSAYVGLFVRMLGLDNDARDREHAICTLRHYSLGGQKCIDEIMQFPGCINLIISLLKSESARACEAAAGLLHNITSVKLYRDVAIESGAMEEIFSCIRKSTITPEIKEQCLCTIWNFSIDENLRYKLLGSDMLIPIVRFLDDEDIKVKEVAASITSYLTLSHSYHGALVEAGVIPKLVHLLQTKDDDYKIIRKEARSSLVELSTDDSYHALIVDQGLVRIPLVGSSAYKAFRPQPHSWPSFPDGSEIQRSSRPSKYGATELLLGLIPNEKKAEPDEAKINAMIGRSNQQFLARVGAIEFDYEGKEQSGSQRNDHYTILPWIDGVARLVLIIGLQDVSAIAKAAHAIGDASVNEHMRTSFMEAGAVKSLLQLLMHNDVPVREASAYALEKLSVSSKVCEKIRVEDGRELLVNVLKDSNTPVEQLEKIIHILTRILDMEVSMITAPDYYASTGSEDIVDDEKCSQGNVDGELNGTSQNLLKQDELDSCSNSIFDFDVISRLIKVLKESSPSLQEKCATLLEHLAACEQHGTAMTAARTESVIEAVLEMGVIHGTTCNPENLDEPPTIMVEVSQAVGATVRLLTKLLNFDIFARSINSVRIVALLRRTLQSSVLLQSKDWVTACLIKLESRGLVDRSVGDIGMEITIYHTIPRLVEQMMTSFSSEKKRKAVIELNRIISGGVMEYTTAVATAGGIFPLVKMLEEGEGDVLEASLAVLYNLSLDPENHPPIIAAGAVPLLKRIVHVESPHWNRALQLLRTLPV